MNRLEFNTVLNVLGIKHLETKVHPNYEEYFYRYNDFIISFCTGKYYAIVSGKIPLEVANIIYNKHPGNPYKIRVNGGQEGWEPNYWAIDKSYINTYHIDTKEGLLIFLLEMHDYEARRNNLPENYVKLYQTFVNDVSRRLILAIKPEIAIDEWMKDAKNVNEDEENSYDLYLQSLGADKSAIDKDIRKLLRKFDYAVNPFQRYENWIMKTENIFEKLKINAFVFENENGMKREDCIEMYLTDLNTNNFVRFSRQPDGYIYDVDYNISEKYKFEFYHYFSNHSFDNINNGEIILVRLYENHKCILDIKYNVTKNTFGKAHKGYAPITIEQKQFIREKLSEAVKYASDITINKTKTNKTSKKLTLSKKL